MSGTIQPPSQWTTGEDPVTSKQAAFLTKLADDKGVSVDTEHMNKAEASQKIDELKTTAPAPSTSVSSSDDKKDTQGGSSDDTAVKAPSEWTTGDDPATSKQKAYIAVLEKRAGEGVHGLDGLGKGEASEMIEDLRKRTGE